MPHGRRKRSKHTAKAVRRPHLPAASPAPAAPALLAAVAAALNDCEYAGIPVELAHGAVIAEEGYVFRIGPDTAPWAVRTRTLTEFPAEPPVIPGDD